MGKWKLITGGYMDEFKEYPMGAPMIGWSDYGNGWGFQAVRNTFFSIQNCGAGCLYDVFGDPIAKHDVAKQNPDIVKKMKAELDKLNEGKFQPDRGEPDAASCTRWNGFYGPWIDVPADV